MKTRKKVKVKKYFTGGSFDQNLGQLTSTVNTALIGVAAQQDAKKLAERQRREEEKTALNTAKQEDTLLLGEHELDGRVGAEYYNKLGGGLNTTSSYSSTGGKLKRLSSDMEKVEGNSHAEGGVKLMKGGTATPFAEVEDEEMIKDGNKVYSEYLKSSNGLSYAENAEQLSKEKGKLEKNLNVGDAISNNTIKRKIEVLDNKEDILYKEQESSKMGTSARHFALGGGLDEYVPFIDNAANAILTATTPKLRKPVHVRNRNFKTDVNVSSQIGDINRAVDANTKTILENTSNSAAARNAITRTRLRGSAQKAKVRQTKENAENTLKNREIVHKERIAALNANISNRFNNQQTARQGAIQSRISQNFSNLAGDFIDKRNFDEAKRYNNEQLATVRSLYNNGIVRRTDDRFLKELSTLTGN